MGKNKKNRNKSKSKGKSKPNPNRPQAKAAPANFAESSAGSGGSSGPRISTGLFAAGLALLIVAAGASLALVLESFGAMSLPGCGEGSGCARAAASVWGKIPGLNWPLSSVGLAYFIGLGVAFAMSRGGVPSGLRWLVRASTLGSVMLIAVMITGGYLCKYCLLVHGANLAFWVTLEVLPLTPVGSTKRLVAVFGSFVLSLGTLLIVESNVRKQVETQAKAEAEESIAEIPNSNADLAFTGRYHHGPRLAPMHIVMFTDYQCPDCNAIEEQIDRIFAERTDVSLSVKHFPFCTDCNPVVSRTLHYNACKAAQAAEAAGTLGGDEAFFKMHFWLFDRDGEFTDPQLDAFVATLGLNVAQFRLTMSSTATDQLIKADAAEANRLGLHYTPMIFINGTQLRGVAIPDVLYNAIQRIAARGPEARPDAVPPPAAEKFIEDWRRERIRQLRVDNAPHTTGPADAPLRVEVFSDYMDDKTATLDRLIRGFAAERNNVHYSFRNYPGHEACNPQVTIKLNPYSCTAHRALEAISIVGGEAAYMTMRDWVFNNQASFNDATLRAKCLEIGLDHERVLAAMGSSEVEERILDDVIAGAPHGIRGLPTVFVNGKKIPRLWVGEECVIEEIMAEALGVRVNPGN